MVAGVWRRKWYVLPTVQNARLWKPIQPQKKFNQVTAVRFKKSVLLGKDRRSSQQHEMTIQREHHKWVSYFHNEFETQQQTKDSVLHNAFLSVYWLAREEIANRKFKSVTAKYFVALYFLSSLKRFLVLVLWRYFVVKFAVTFLTCGKWNKESYYPLY